MKLSAPAIAPRAQGLDRKSFMVLTVLPMAPAICVVGSIVGIGVTVTVGDAVGVDVPIEGGVVPIRRGRGTDVAPTTIIIIRKAVTTDGISRHTADGGEGGQAHHEAAEVGTSSDIQTSYLPLILHIGVPIGQIGHLGGDDALALIFTYFGLIVALACIAAVGLPSIVHKLIGDGRIGD